MKILPEKDAVPQTRKRPASDENNATKPALT